MMTGLQSILRSRPILLAAKCRPMIAVSKNMRYMQIFAGDPDRKPHDTTRTNMTTGLQNILRSIPILSAAKCRPMIAVSKNIRYIITVTHQWKRDLLN